MSPLSGQGPSTAPAMEHEEPAGKPAGGNSPEETATRWLDGDVPKEDDAKEAPARGVDSPPKAGSHGTRRGQPESGAGKHEGSASAAPAEQCPRTTSARDSGPHPWDDFFNAPVQQEDDGEKADDGLAKERSAPHDRHSYDRRGRVEWRPGAANGACPLDDERISHCLGRILRYHTERYGLQSDAEGFVPIAALLSDVPDFEGVTEADIRRVVQGSAGPRGPRFEVRDADEADQGSQIRARYKHPQDGYRQSGPPGGFYGRGGWGKGRMYGPPPWFSEAAYGGRQPFPRGPRQRPGFSRPPPPQDGEEEEEEEEGEAEREGAEPRVKQEAAAASKPASGKEPGTSSQPVEARGSVAKEVAAAATGEAAAARSCGAGEAAQGAGAAPSSDSAVSTTASSPQQDGEVWERYVEPDSQRAWFWNEATEEMFYADDEESGWQSFFNAEDKPWWWHEATGRFFYEEES
mmetsp:Transcript_101031/g.245706  ORF Transcript_101031/g.245706 Transcript_101031/m.245706 type:complete len:463 (-) Transcript_101031:25-1413(-)